MFPPSDHSFPLTHLPSPYAVPPRLAPAAATPLTDQFMSSVWPKDGIPWVQASGSLTANLKSSPHRGRRRRGKDRIQSPPSRGRTAGTGRRTGSAPTTVDAVPGPDEPDADLDARFSCGVPGCGHRFPEARLLALHLRMGHNDFGLERMKAAREGTEGTCTLDGVSITAPIDVGGHVRLAEYDAVGCKLFRGYCVSNLWYRSRLATREQCNAEGVRARYTPHGETASVRK